MPFMRRTHRHKLIHWIQHPELDELYDLKEDPREDRNLFRDGGHHDIVQRLRAELGGLVERSLGL